MTQMSNIVVLVDRTGGRHWRSAGDRLTKCGLDPQVGWTSIPLVTLNDSATCQKCIRIDRWGTL